MLQSTCIGSESYSIVFPLNSRTWLVMSWIGGQSMSRTSLRNLQSTHGALRGWRMKQQQHTGCLACRMTSSGMTAIDANCCTPSDLAGTSSTQTIADNSSVESLVDLPGGRARTSTSMNHGSAKRPPKYSVGS